MNKNITQAQINDWAEITALKDKLAKAELERDEWKAHCWRLNYGVLKIKIMDAEDLLGESEDLCDSLALETPAISLATIEGAAVNEFAISILHGDEDHQKWLLDEAIDYAAKKAFDAINSAKESNNADPK